MKKVISTLILITFYLLPAQAQQPSPGNPIFPGWYADPEAIIFGKQCWIYPTYSAKYEEQVFLDAFSSTNLQKWTNTPESSTLRG